MIAKLLLTIAAIPLAIYPGILMAGMMGLAAEPSPHANPLTVAVAKAFLWSSLLYPLGYGAGVSLSQRSEWAGVAVALGHLSVCLILLAAWYAMSK